MAKAYGCDISGPARTAREAVQWLYFGYLAAVKEQNGAAMSLGRTSTFLDIYFQRDMAAGTLTEEQAQEIVDDFVVKLRIVRFLRTPEYDELFAGDPTWVTESIGGMGDDGRSIISARRRNRISRSGTRRASRTDSETSPRRSPSTPAPSSSRAMRSCAAAGATTAPSPAASRRC
jgi:formate acetyltransferase 1